MPLDKNMTTDEAALEAENEVLMETLDPFLDGNDVIETAIGKYHADPTRNSLIAVMNTIRARMHADGHFIIPVIPSEDGREFTFQTVTTSDEKEWLVAFTSPEEYRKGKPDKILSNFIDWIMKACLDLDVAGIVLNPWGQDFKLTKELIDLIFKADGGLEYRVMDNQITPKLLEDGSFLKKAIEICNRNRTQLNLIRLLKILRDSQVWIPCTAIFSEADQAAFGKMISEAMDKNDPDSLVGEQMVTRDEVRMVPDILQSKDQFFFPVFTSKEEMGQYGETFSKLKSHFLHAVNLARNNERNVSGIVINAFSEPFIVPKDLFDLIAEMPSAFENEEAEDNCQQIENT